MGSFNTDIMFQQDFVAYLDRLSYHDSTVETLEIDLDRVWHYGLGSVAFGDL